MLISCSADWWSDTAAALQPSWMNNTLSFNAMETEVLGRTVQQKQARLRGAALPPHPPTRPTKMSNSDPTKRRAKREGCDT